MKGDRVTLKSLQPFKNQQDQPITCVYKLVLNSNGEPQFGHDGTVSIELAGGVPDGTTGVIDGPLLHVSRAQLKEYANSPGMSVNEKLPLFPIKLDVYQQVAWVCGDNLKVVSGGL